MWEKINAVLSGIVVPLMLISVGLFYAWRLKFFHILKPRAVLRGLCSEEKKGGVSSAKAVSLALAGTLGVGNIVGVSSAICLGGFGAVFWMWISALVAMILKYAEIVLAMRYRRFDSDGRPHGSAMDYISAFFLSKKFKRTARAVSCLFAAAFLLNALTMGSMLQANAVCEALHGVFDIPVAAVAAVLLLIALVSVRKSGAGLAALTEYLVPIMSVGYVVISITIMILKRDGLADALRLIFSSAFTRESTVYGIGGYAFTSAVRYGVMRGLISNEAGCGTAPAAHAISDCTVPAKQGMWGIFEVFADTVVLCTMTALCVILNYSDAVIHTGNYMMMTVAAYSSVLGDYASVFLCVAVFCFGSATIMCWAHYGKVCVSYFGKSKWLTFLFSLTYCGCMLWGCFVSSDTVWQLSDLAMSVMTVINLAVIAAMWREVKGETELFINSQPNGTIKGSGRS